MEVMPDQFSLTDADSGRKLRSAFRSRIKENPPNSRLRGLSISSPIIQTYSGRYAQDAGLLSEANLPASRAGVLVLPLLIARFLATLIIVVGWGLLTLWGDDHSIG